MSDLREIIALAIRGADKSFFNEDYGKQAAAVLSALRKAGYEVVPNEASDALVDFACDNLPFGRLKQQDFIRQLYQLLVENARKYP
ncbi:hypothetical protein [Arenibaculum pallidiluteum]|uniref:hypothetical protein n=1 Tax=Arenibaculum pallidiluteum TaxID=2812559 RepID=UPI001A959968|nr:hypothetical protein [Arenibaculum pallidiluteum]